MKHGRRQNVPVVVAVDEAAGTAVGAAAVAADAVAMVVVVAADAAAIVETEATEAIAAIAGKPGRLQVAKQLSSASG
jgi:hypothetical protein